MTIIKKIGKVILYLLLAIIILIEIFSIISMRNSNGKYVKYDDVHICTDNSELVDDEEVYQLSKKNWETMTNTFISIKNTEIISKNKNEYVCDIENIENGKYGSNKKDLFDSIADNDKTITRIEYNDEIYLY